MGKPLGVGAEDYPGVGARVGEHVVCCLGYGKGLVVATKANQGIGARVIVYAWLWFER